MEIIETYVFSDQYGKQRGIWLYAMELQRIGSCPPGGAGLACVGREVDRRDPTCEVCRKPQTESFGYRLVATS